MADLESIKQNYQRLISEAQDLKQLELIRLSLFGKQGEISLLLRDLKNLADEDRRQQGLIYNQIKDELFILLENRKNDLEHQQLERQLATQYLDVSLPLQFVATGAVHPLSQAMFEATQILGNMGFTIAEGPEIEDDFFNFSALNIPPEHPARQDHDTFYFSSQQVDTQSAGSNEQNAEVPRRLLRTQTSPVQIHTLQNLKPPLKIIAPGRVFRNDYDQTHTPNFHQIEGLYIDQNIHMGHLKGCLMEFCRQFFNKPDLKLRFRPGYFPFTEPSAEVDIACTRKDSQLIVGEGDDWLEVLGSGMVHPNVLKNCGLDPDEWQGFAFGLGLERFAMLKYGILDLRTFYDPQPQWLKHYGFSPFAGLI